VKPVPKPIRPSGPAPRLPPEAVQFMDDMGYGYTAVADAFDILQATVDRHPDEHPTDDPNDQGPDPNQDGE